MLLILHVRVLRGVAGLDSLADLGELVEPSLRLLDPPDLLEPRVISLDQQRGAAAARAVGNCKCPRPAFKSGAADESCGCDGEWWW